MKSFSMVLRSFKDLIFSSEKFINIIEPKRTISYIFSTNGDNYDCCNVWCLVWCPGQNKRIAPLSFLHGYRKRRLKD
jgi:hypothetical protein